MSSSWFLLGLSGPSGSPPVGGSVPQYHSNPGFPKKIYLDFDGQLVTGTSWNNQNYTGSYNTGTTINAPAFSTDSDLANYSTSELAAIQETWARVAEDYCQLNRLRRLLKRDVTDESK